MATVKVEEKAADPDEADRQRRIREMPPLEQCYNLMDFEAVARRVMKKTAWGYYSSAADDEIVMTTASPFASLDRGCVDLGADGPRQCAKTTAPTTASGSGRGSWWT